MGSSVTGSRQGRGAARRETSLGGGGWGGGIWVPRQVGEEWSM